MSDKTCPVCGCLRHSKECCVGPKPAPSELSPAHGSVSKAQRLWDALRRIASYDPPERVRRDAEPMGLDENEAVEMAYENVIAEAKAAVRQMRRPK